MRTFVIILTVLFLAGPLWAASPVPAPPAKLADFAQVDIFADAAVGALNEGCLVRGHGWLCRENWPDLGRRGRSYLAGLEVSRLAWSPLALQFTPRRSGTLTVTLDSPWEEQSPGVIYRQDVCFDAVSATGASLTNGSFEMLVGRAPAGWERVGAPVPVSRSDPAPFEGRRYVIVWTGSTLRQTLAVTGGIPVTLSFQARARTPAGYVAMPPLRSRNTPAYRAARQFMRGVNLSHYLEAPAGEDWGQRYTTDDFARIKSEGFDHVRIPCAWQNHTDPAPDYTISNAFFAVVDALVAGAVTNGLNAIVDIHNFYAFSSDPASNSAEFYGLWEQIARHYSNAPPGVAFELLNEPLVAAPGLMNPINAEAIRRIRALQPRRTIFVGCANANDVNALEALRLPEDDNLIVTIHDYEPFPFTHQGADWAGWSVATTNVVYPGPPETPLEPDAFVASQTRTRAWFDGYNRLERACNPSGRAAFEDRLRYVRLWSDTYGRPVYVGEWGCYMAADPASRARFHADKQAVLDELGLGWALWDWKANFGYWDESFDRPRPGLREALFPRKDAPRP